MAKNSIIEYVGDGSTTQYTINFTGGYTLESHVFCQVNNEVDGSGNPIYRTLTFVSAGVVDIGGTVPGIGEPIVFRRITPVDTPVVDFEDGVTFTEEDIDAGFEQVLFGIQEAQDNLEDATSTEEALVRAEDAQSSAEAARDAAQLSEANAGTSETNAGTSSTSAAASAAAALASENAAAISESNAAIYETGAASSASNAAASESNTAASASNASTSATNAASSASTSATSASNAATSETNSATSATDAATSETNASTSETNAAASATSANSSALSAGVHSLNAGGSATAAATSATNAATSESNASTSESNAAASNTNANTSETNASNSATAAATSETNAAISESNAAASAASAASDVSLTNADVVLTHADAASTAADVVTSAANAAAADVLKIEWQGAYSGGTTYSANDAVVYNNSSYICILASTGNLPTDPIYWDILALKGTDGSGAGDMLASTYDPNAVGGDAFDMDNMTEGTTTKVFTNVERSKLAAIEEAADVTDETNVVAALSGATITGVTKANADQVLILDASDSNKLKQVAMSTIGGNGDLLSANNLSDIANAVTARSNLGLGNVNNTSDATKPVSTATQAALDLKINTSGIGSSVQAYNSNIPTVAASQAEMEAGTQVAIRSMSPLRVKQAIEANASGGPTGSNSANGYIAFGNGIYLQWGTLGVSGDNNVTFPIAFPSTCASLTWAGGPTGSTDTWYGRTRSISRTGFTVWLHGTAAPGRWMAIGY